MAFRNPMMEQANKGPGCLGNLIILLILAAVIGGIVVFLGSL